MRSLEDIEVIITSHKDELKDEYGISTIGIFGSYIRKENTKDSDVDILVEFHKTIDLFSFVHLKNYLSELLGIEVDLVMRKGLKPNIGKRILKDIVYL